MRKLVFHTGKSSLDLLVAFGSNTIIGSFEIRGNPEELEKYRDKDLDLEIKLHREKRSIDANNMLWACLGDIAKALNADPWDMYLYMLKRYGVYVPMLVRAEAAKDMKRLYRETEEVGRRIIDDEEWVDLLCFIGSSNYNTAEFSHLLDGVISEMKGMHLDVPPSEDMKRALERWEKEYERRTKAGENEPE